MSAPDTIVLVHGFWVTPRSWEHWITHYESRGFTVIAPGYPGFEVEVEALNADPTPIVELTVPKIMRSTPRRSTSCPHRRSSSVTRPVARSPRSCSTTASAPRAWRSTPRPPRACGSCRCRS
ncbi:esterase/lipase family protein [Luedemannella flava]